MPNMMFAREQHNLIAVSNKLFVIGGENEQSFVMAFEVYDEVCKKFVALKPIPKFNDCFGPVGAFMVGRQILVFGIVEEVAFYDVDKNKWTVGSCAIEKVPGFFLSKVPQT